MEKILKVKKIFEQQIINYNKNILYNYSTGIHYNIIKTNIDKIISEFYFIDIIEFEELKNNLIKNFLILKNKNYYYYELCQICDEIIDILNFTYYPVHMNITNSHNTYNKINNIINNCIPTPNFFGLKRLF